MKPPPKKYKFAFTTSVADDDRPSTPWHDREPPDNFHVDVVVIRESAPLQSVGDRPSSVFNLLNALVLGNAVGVAAVKVERLGKVLNLGDF